MSRDDSVLKRHAKMLFDLERTIPLLKAIQKKVRPGDVVVDLGCGLGVLSLAAVRSGAKRVYAIDVDGEAIDFGRRQAKKLGVEKKIVWLNDHSFNIDLAEKADLLIQETIGPLAFDENFLPTLIDAKKRLLKKNGKIIPEGVCLYGMPIDPRKKPLYQPTLLTHIKTKSTTRSSIQIERRWKVKEKLGGIFLWPKIIWAKGLETDASPLQKQTHWGQTFLPYGARHPVLKKQGVRLTLRIQSHPQNPLYNTQIEWQIH